MSLAPDKLAKARAFWAAKAARRKSPFNCGRCGNILLFRAHPESDGAGRMCPKCRAWMADYRRRKREKPVTVDAGALAALETRIAKVEHNLAMMQLASRVAYKQGYAVCECKHRRNTRRYADALPTISAQEAASFHP
jgi:hypothetical protein